MSVLITGGTGFIGSHLAQRFLAKGEAVRILAKLNTRQEQENAVFLEREGAEIIVGSVADIDLVKESVKGIKKVFHIAAVMREANVPGSTFWDVNVKATKRLLETSSAEGVERFVYCSTVGVMGRPASWPADEETVCRPMDIYQKTKYEAEKVILEYFKKTQFPLVIIRPPEVYGPRDYRLLKLFRSIKSRKFLMIGDGKGKHHLLYIDDLTDGMELAAEKEKAIGKVFILADEEAVELERFVRMIANEFGVKIPRIHIPFAPVYVLATAVEFACRPFRIQPPLYRRRINFFRHNYSFDISKARNDLGYSPKVHIESGISRTIKWYSEAGLL